MDRYEKGPTIGEGTYGSVYRATNRATGRVVAIKKVRLGEARDGVHITALREIKLLQELHHPNVIQLLEVFQHKNKLHLVFEHCAADLEVIIKDRSILLSHADVKAYVQMALQGLHHVHSQGVIHRDIKPNNMLVTAGGVLKLADFGLARLLQGTPNVAMTKQVFSRWYRSPELLFGASHYGTSADLWALGCMAMELLLRRTWLPGSSDVDQLERIFQARGTPSDADWPEARSLPTFMAWQPIGVPPLHRHLPLGSEACPQLLDLLEGLLQLNPAHRPSAAQALAHPYFTVEPQPSAPAALARSQRRERSPLSSAPRFLNLPQGSADAASHHLPDASCPAAAAGR